jgi:hypothetical protein
MISEESSKKSTDAKKKTEDQPSTSSNETPPVALTAPLALALDETGSFRICTPPNCARQAAEVLRKLSDREREMWCRRFTQSCLEKIESSEAVDEQTKVFFRDVQRKLKEQ